MAGSRQRRKHKRRNKGNKETIESKPLSPDPVKPMDVGVTPMRSRIWCGLKWACSPACSLLKSRSLRRAKRRSLERLGVVGTVVGLWIACWPHVYVYPSEDLDPNNPMFTPFVVRNEGYLTIRDVQFSCSGGYLDRKGGPSIYFLGKYENSFKDVKQVSRVIRPGEEASELLPLTRIMKDMPLENADVAVVLEFQPWKWIPYTRKEKHRFEVKRKGDRWHWCPQPVNK